MPSSEKTPNIGLNRWLPSDKPMMNDFNADNTKVDTRFGDIWTKDDVLTDETAISLGHDPADDPTPNDAFATLQSSKVSEGKILSWLPSIQGQTTAGVYGYSDRDGWYVRRGRIVHFGGYVGLSSIITPGSGRLTFKGLPYVAYSGGAAASISHINNYGYTVTPTLQIGDNSIYANIPGVGSLQIANITSAFYIGFSGSYIIA